jgi:hypothetical protein
MEADALTVTVCTCTRVRKCADEATATEGLSQGQTMGVIHRPLTCVTVVVIVTVTNTNEPLGVEV